MYQNWQIPNGNLWYNPHFLPTNQANNLFTYLQSDKNIAWRQDTIRMFGRQVLTPRLSAWYGNEGASYTYSGLQLQPNAWTAELLALKQAIETVIETESVVQASFNSVLLNFYRNGQDSMGWHADDEPELGNMPTIASVSLGGDRRFLLRAKDNHSQKHEIVLSNGSLLIMSGNTQHYWQHAIPKTLRPTNARINLTFRQIVKLS